MLVLSSIGLVLLSPSFFRLCRVVVLSPLHLQGGVAFAASSFSVVVPLSSFWRWCAAALPHPSPSPSRTSFFHTWCDGVASITEERPSAPARRRRCGHHHHPKRGGGESTSSQRRTRRRRKAQAPQGVDEGSATQRRTREGTTTHKEGPRTHHHPLFRGGVPFLQKEPPCCYFSYFSAFYFAFTLKWCMISPHLS